MKHPPRTSKYFGRHSGVDSRSGIALFMIIAILMSLLIMGTTYILGNSRGTEKAQLLVQLKADYNLESAFLIQMNKLRWQAPSFSSPETALSLSRREIAPGITLSADGSRIGTSTFRLTARIEGGSINRHLGAILTFIPVRKPLDGEPSTQLPIGSADISLNFSASSGIVPSTTSLASDSTSTSVLFPASMTPVIETASCASTSSFPSTYSSPLSSSSTSALLTTDPVSVPVSMAQWSLKYLPPSVTEP
ncbi:MAG: hypothetical protein WA705_07720 [Candidatus Ozemobacteraceae bacterium]